MIRASTTVRERHASMASNRFGCLVTSWLALALIPALCGAQPSNSRQSVLAITGGTLLDVRTGKQIQDAVILVEGSRISGVGPRISIDVPPTARIVDARGRWIVPGLFDMHVHGSSRADVPLELYLANGVTSVRDMGGNLTTLRLTREALERGERLGPRLFLAGPILDGAAPSAPAISIIADTSQRAVSAVNFLADQGVDAIKVYNSIAEEVLETIVRTAHARGLPVVGHVPRAITASAAAQMGIDGIEHSAIRSRDLRDWGLLTEAEAQRISTLNSVTERDALVWQHVDLADERVRALIDRLAASGITLDPTLSIDEYDTLFLYSQEAEHPNNRFLPRSFVEETLGPEHDMFKVPESLKAAALAGLRKRAQFVGVCARAGVRIVAGTDGPGIGRLAPGFGLHHELSLLVRAGLTPLAAIRAATLDAAAALRQVDHLGSVETGKLADLVILDADPLHDIEHTRKIHAVVRGGRVFDATALQGMRSAAESKAR
jgi:imidazolonepropionase-like amidohydrolase